MNGDQARRSHVTHAAPANATLGADSVADRVADRAADRVADRVADRAADTAADRVADRVADNAAQIKQCCARLYESEVVRRLLGDSFHPGGAPLTERLGRKLGLTPDSLVLDAASGAGTSAILIAQRFECSVVGIDLSAHHVNRAAAEVDRLGLAHRIRFDVGDAERLPVEDASVDAVICECAFCTFPDKPAAARDFARVLKPGGRLGLSDITREPGPPGELTDLMAWIACLADARPAEAYASFLVAAGFRDVAIERHDEALTEMVRGIGARLFASEILAGLDKIDLAGFDTAAARRLARDAMTAIAERRLGYAIVYGTKTRERDGPNPESRDDPNPECATARIPGAGLPRTLSERLPEGR